MATRKTTKKQNTRTASARKSATKRSAATSAKPKVQAAPKPEPVPEILAVSGVYPGIDAARAAYDSLVQAGFMERSITASAMRPVEVPEQSLEERAEAAVAGAEAYASNTARIAGSMLALGTVPLLAPVLVAGPLLAAVFGVASGVRDNDCPAMEPERPVLVVVNCVGRKTAERAKEILENTGAANIAMGEVQDGSDLQSREYRDDSGNLHHHTRTYVRDHVA